MFISSKTHRQMQINFRMAHSVAAHNTKAARRSSCGWQNHKLSHLLFPFHAPYPLCRDSPAGKGATVTSKFSRAANELTFVCFCNRIARTPANRPANAAGTDHIKRLFARAVARGHILAMGYMRVPVKHCVGTELACACYKRYIAVFHSVLVPMREKEDKTVELCDHLGRGHFALIENIAVARDRYNAFVFQQCGRGCKLAHAVAKMDKHVGVIVHFHNLSQSAHVAVRIR